MDRTPYCDRFELKCRPIEKAKGVWWPFRDPFDPGFRAEVRRQMKLHEREMNDPWCFGFFVDNLHSFNVSIIDNLIFFLIKSLKISVKALTK